MEGQVRVDQRAGLIEPRRGVFVAQPEIERHVVAHAPRVGEVVRLARRAEFDLGQPGRQFGEALIAKQKVGKRGSGGRRGRLSARWRCR